MMGFNISGDGNAKVHEFSWVGSIILFLFKFSNPLYPIKFTQRYHLYCYCKAAIFIQKISFYYLELHKLLFLIDCFHYFLCHTFLTILFKYKFIHYINITLSIDDLGYQPSYTWRSILEGRSLLLEASAWKIGDGSSIGVWNTNWLPSGHILRYDSASTLGPNATISALISSVTHTWDIDILRLHFDETIVQQIIHTPINVDSSDSIWWPHTSNGAYTVKSGYKMASRSHEWDEQSSTGARNSFWDHIWKLSIHPRIRNLLWRVVWGILPLRSRLRSKGISVEPQCGLCGSHFEDFTHLFDKCKQSKQMWSILNIALPSIDDFTCPRHWITSILSGLNQQLFKLFAYGLEAIWNARNKFIFEGKQPHPDIMAARASGSLDAFTAANTRDQPARIGAPHTVSSWQRPSPGWDKLNCDASTISNEAGVGLGAIIRRSDGTTLVAATKFIPTIWPVNLCEAQALKFGIQLAQQQGCSRLIIEGDAQSLITQALHNTFDNSLAGACVRDAYALLQTFDDFRLQWIHRSCNETANRLARWSRHQRNTQIWRSRPPDWLLDTLVCD